jgi:CheY-like chemotaxis protein
VLVVDDDPTFRKLFQSVLEKRGYLVVAVDGGVAAQLIYASEGPFDCSVIDYLMPGLDGIGLIRWLHDCDPALSSLLVTAHGDKQTVEQAWAAGASGFIDKPPTAADLTLGVERAVSRSRENRRMARMSADVHRVANTQRSILRSSTGPRSQGIRITHHPFHQAGGDFLVRCPVSDTETLVLAADVSGHDLNAAFLAAYFQGLVRGMLRRAAPLEEILDFFNHVLLEEWNRSDAEKTPDPASIAVTALWIDSQRMHLNVAVNGNPLPILTDTEGNSLALAEPACPLGWFPGPSTRQTSYRWKPGSSVRLWTDGLDDLAERLDVDPLAVAFALHRAHLLGEARPGWVEQAGDDVMAVSVNLLHPDQASWGFEPLIREKYCWEQLGGIDQWQEKWRRSLTFALSGLSGESLFDILIVARETVLNALQHGCQPGETASFQAAFDPDAGTLRLIVNDPGPGYDSVPSTSTMEDQVEDDFGRRHRGLQLIEGLSRRVRSMRRGAELWIDLDVKFDDALCEGNPASDRI